MRYLSRTRPLLAVAIVGLAGPAFIVAFGKDTDAPLRLRLVGLILVSLLALTWEDRAAPLVAATPVGLPLVQRGRLLLLVVGASTAWLLACVATIREAQYTSLWSASIEVAAIGALLTAIVGGLARERPGESLSIYPMPLLLGLLVIAFRMPERWALVASPDSPVWIDVHRRWAVLLVVGLLAVAWVARDPVSRLRRPRRLSAVG